MATAKKKTKKTKKKTTKKKAARKPTIEEHPSPVRYGQFAPTMAAPERRHTREVAREQDITSRKLAQAQADLQSLKTGIRGLSRKFVKMLDEFTTTIKVIEEQYRNNIPFQRGRDAMEMARTAITEMGALLKATSGLETAEVFSRPPEPLVGTPGEPD